MRTRILIAAGLLATVVGACSRPSGEAVQPEEPESRDISLVPVADDAAVASELEAPRPEPGPRPAPAPERARPVEAAPVGTAVAVVHEHPVPEPEPDAAPEFSGHPRADDVEASVSGPSAGTRGGGKPRVPMTEGAGRVPDYPEAGPGPRHPGEDDPAIVRGGAGSIDDDCAVHRPPRVGEVRPQGGTAVLINERSPRRGPAQPSTGIVPRGPQLGRGGIR